jgi:hypothetical protein
MCLCDVPTAEPDDQRLASQSFHNTDCLEIIENARYSALLLVFVSQMIDPRATLGSRPGTFPLPLTPPGVYVRKESVSR